MATSETDDDMEAVEAAIDACKEKPLGPSFERIRKEKWAALDSKPLKGYWLDSEEDMATALALIARNASVNAAKSYPGHDFSYELQSAAYAEAYARYCSLMAHGTPEIGGKDRRYDPSRGSSIEAAIFSAAVGAARNAAAQMVDRNNKRGASTRPVFALDEAREKQEFYGSAVTESANWLSYDETSEVDTDGTEAGGDDKAITRAAKKAAKGKSADVLKWTTRVKPSAEASMRRVERDTRVAGEVCLFDLIHKRPKDDQEVFLPYWGVLGRKKETISQIAARLEWPRAHVICRLKALHKDLGIKDEIPDDGEDEMEQLKLPTKIMDDRYRTSHVPKRQWPNSQKLKKRTFFRGALIREPDRAKAGGPTNE